MTYDGPNSQSRAMAKVLAERTAKTLLWARGGFNLSVGGPTYIGEHIARAYAPGGARVFDANFMGSDVYEHPFAVRWMEANELPQSNEVAEAIGGHLNGLRIGFDAGASDRKVTAMAEGEVIFQEEVDWNPKVNTDPRYHYHHVMSALHMAAAHLPGPVQGTGVSSAGIWIDNRCRAASLFRGVKEKNPEAFPQARDLFLRIQKEWGGVPSVVANDGDVTALAGAMMLEDDGILGIAMGSDEAGGYWAIGGGIMGWLNELAFVPVDLSDDAPVHEWSKDRGCGSSFFSQQAVARLAPKADIVLPAGMSQPDQLKEVQALMANDDERAARIYQTIGAELGYAIAWYAFFYQLKHVLILGRVTTGEGGKVILTEAQRVLGTEFPELAAQITLHLPEGELERRVGQAVAAASLPTIA
ncbi:MAG: ROK family protein [Candidatus Berkelbacteria bacterium]|nr:ROK family protein [Candidatus Berkelbacteria bacterium]